MSYVPYWLEEDAMEDSASILSDPLWHLLVANGDDIPEYDVRTGAAEQLILKMTLYAEPDFESGEVNELTLHQERRRRQHVLHAYSVQVSSGKRTLAEALASMVRGGIDYDEAVDALYLQPVVEKPEPTAKPVHVPTHADIARQSKMFAPWVRAVRVGTLSVDDALAKMVKCGITHEEGMKLLSL